MHHSRKAWSTTRAAYTSVDRYTLVGRDGAPQGLKETPRSARDRALAQGAAARH